MSASERPAAPISLFYSYSHKDEALAEGARDPPEPPEAPGGHQRLARPPHRGRDRVGGQIDQHLDAAGVILLLVSADFLASDYC